MAVIEFGDDGSCVDEAQSQAATQCISEARASARNPNGALVLVFIHGWHHNAEWNTKTDGGDRHFHGFREVLKALTLREAERYLSSGSYGGRRVIGIYIGWSGDPPDSRLKRIPVLTDLSFYERMRTAGEIGSAPPIEKAIQEIVLATKRPLDGALMARPESPLIMIGHSFGALMLESVFCSLLKAEGDPLVFNSMGEPEKTIEAGAIGYSPPVLISMTSLADIATGFFWRIANPTHKTDGHDASLFTHEFKRDIPTVLIQPKGGFVDFGQDWHSLKPPEPPKAATPAFFIDLPKRQRKGQADQPEHERYKLAPLTGCDTSHLAWVFQVPSTISNGHNDIFNFKSRLLIMALVQISGAVMSLAEDFEQNFEADDRLTPEEWNWYLQTR